MILCEPFTVFYCVKRKKKKKKTKHSQQKRKEKQKQSTHNDGALMRFVLTIETKHSEHVNAIGFFFFLSLTATWNNGGGAANGDK